MAFNQQPRRNLYALTRGFAQDTTGATAIEYALIASLVAVVIIGAVIGLGSSLQTKYQATSDAIQ